MSINKDQDPALLEQERIRVLYKYGILDTPPDGSFDRLTKLAAKLLDVPIATIGLVDTDRIWFKSKYGLKIQEVSRDTGFCASAILADGFYSGENAGTDPKFYAAFPLKNKNGHNLGIFCVMDNKPFQLNESQKDILEDLRDIAMDQIELQLAAGMSIAQHNQILNTTAHDLKNPLTTIPVRADLIKLKKNDLDAVDMMCDQIKATSLNMVRIIDELLQSGSMEAGKVHLLLIKVNLSDLVSNAININQPLAERKNQTLIFVPEADISVDADESKLTEIVDNLINNAIKYSPQNTNIFVKIKEQQNKAVIEVQDEGPGLSPGDKELLFQRFTRLSAKPTGGENSTGLGLSIVKILVEAHEGKIWAESEGKDKGSKFIVELPVKNS